MNIRISFSQVRSEVELAVRDGSSRVISKIRWVFWPFLNYRQPAPPRAKRAVLARYGSHADTWVETGTYFGHTSRWLASLASKVVTIEPEERLANRATRRMSRLENVTVIKGFSESVLPEVISELSGSVAFWLDGHYSGGVTASGHGVTPIKQELTEIEKNFSQFSSVTVLIDDFRLFESREIKDSSYPPRAELVDWAVRNKLAWTVEHDIFVASTRPLN